MHAPTYGAQVKVVDVFAMPQSGTGVSVEAVDPVFQTKMLDMLKQVGRPEMVVGWYHSHPGFGCWLSGVDINTQQAREGKECYAMCACQHHPFPSFIACLQIFMVLGDARTHVARCV
jgi:proteasome lid subunit RPN8/RPN11